ncbi:hypothetical protein GBAR_LOCUS7342 [Geodia barretti]|uniref:C-CAP/cofactor C-like domain-containing protein n=1 Tax=Geodia barretti TaxID=519541 RepID=A0AA35RIK4_GEOBA|nr:hypothetical protein GBAR_LOCUS7342 [Geodia barretti]
MSEAKEAPKGLQALFSRPRKFYEKVESGTVAMTSAATELVYVRECRDCELRATTKLAKCIIDSCSNVKVALEEPIMSGTLKVRGTQQLLLSWLKLRRNRKNVRSS